MADPTLVARFRAARRNPALVVLEGLHPLKHALRFGGEVLLAVSPDPPAVRSLAEHLCCDVLAPLLSLLRRCAPGDFEAIAPRPPGSKVLALARRPAVVPAAAVLAPSDRRLVLLEQPRHLGNLGAAIRVAAAAEAAGVIVLGEADPWHPTAVRGAAGLQFAVPCLRLQALPALARPLVLFAADGTSLGDAPLPSDAVLAFGSERAGASAELRRQAVRTAAIPMQAGVSSLNLATAVAVALYAPRA